MEKNSGSNSSLCGRIHRAVSTNPAFRAFRRIPSHQSTSVATDSYDPNHAAKTTASNIQNKPHLPQNSKNHHKEGTGIPVQFDYSVPTSEGHANTATSHSGVPSRAAKGKHVQIGTAAAQNDHGQAGGGKKTKQKLDKSDTFGEYIQRAKAKIRTLSNVGGGPGQSNPAADEASGGKKKEHHQNHHQKDHFGEFIQRAKKKIIRTTTNIGKTGSIKRG